MFEHVSRKRILIAVMSALLLPLPMTLFSLNYRQTKEQVDAQKPVYTQICKKMPDYDAKAGFPLPFLFDTNYVQGSSRVGVHNAAAGGPFALLNKIGLDDYCPYYDGLAFQWNLAFYTALTFILLGVRLKEIRAFRQDSNQGQSQ
jgi:hypothetical protein